MIQHDAVFNAIDEAQKTYATDFLAKPSGTDSFALGRAHGVFLGLDHAKKIILESLSDEKEKAR